MQSPNLFNFAERVSIYFTITQLSPLSVACILAVGSSNVNLILYWPDSIGMQKSFACGGKTATTRTIHLTVTSTCITMKKNVWLNIPRHLHRIRQKVKNSCALFFLFVHILKAYEVDNIYIYICAYNIFTNSLVINCKIETKRHKSSDSKKCTRDLWFSEKIHQCCKWNIFVIYHWEETGAN